MKIEHLVPISQLKTTLLSRFAHADNLRFAVDYEDYVDAFTIRIVPFENETAVNYVNEYFGLLYEADSREIVGLRIEDFERNYNSRGRYRTIRPSLTDR